MKPKLMLEAVARIYQQALIADEDCSSDTGDAIQRECEAMLPPARAAAIRDMTKRGEWLPGLEV